MLLIFVASQVKSAISDSCKKVIESRLLDGELTFNGQVVLDHDLELHIRTNLSESNIDIIYVKAELLDPGEEDLRTHLGYQKLPIFVHAGQSGNMTSWQVWLFPNSTASLL